MNVRLSLTCLVSALAAFSVTLVHADDDLVVMQVKLDQVMQPKSATDTFVECTKNTVCKAALDAAAAYVGVDSSKITSAVALISQSKKGEDSDFDYSLPRGYQYCRAKIQTISVVPATGDRASVMTIVGAERNVHVHTWTPVRNLGEGRSWVEANFTIIGVRDELVQQYRASGICTANYVNDDCRGSSGINKGMHACGNIVDQPPLPPSSARQRGEGNRGEPPPGWR